MAAIRWWTRARTVLRRVPVRHRHTPDPDLSALVAFPSCRCGQLLWPESGPARAVRPAQPGGHGLDPLHRH